MRWCYLLFIFATTVGYVFGEDKSWFRLDGSVIPTHYDIELTVFLDDDPQKQFVFDGFVGITLHATTNDVNVITLHQEGLNIETVLLKEENNLNQTFPIINQNYDSETSKLSFDLESSLHRGTNYVLEIIYNGTLENDLDGFYRSSFRSGNKKRNYLAVTHFEPAFARQAYPCFDEPKYKAKFDLRINRLNKYKTYFNTKLTHSFPDGEDRTIDVFMTTPPMSPYTTAFVVTDFEQRFDAENLTILVQQDDYDKAQFALEVGPKILQTLDDYTGYPYASVEGIEKLHMIAVPDFSAGAMENWGLVTFSETLLLTSAYRPAESQQTIATIISHELSHMWFGNLVTCDWWSFAWLNEAFAGYFQFYTTDQVLPELELMKVFSLSETSKALVADASVWNTHTLTNREIYTPSESFGMFTGSITYAKGASLMHMINHAVGVDYFREALQNYLKKNAFKTSVPETFVEAFESIWNVSNISFSDFVKDWTEQTGYPLVTIMIGKGGKHVKINQTEYVRYKTGSIFPAFSSNGTEVEPATKYWSVPISFATDLNPNFEDTKPKAFLTNDGQEIVIDFDKPIKWIVANVQRTGFYRVNYDTKTWNRISSALKTPNFGGIHVINRAVLIEDILTLAFGGYVEWKVVFKFFEYLEHESDYAVWNIVLDCISVLNKRIKEQTKAVQAGWAKTYLSRLYRSLQTGPEKVINAEDAKFRDKLKKWACESGLETSCIEEVPQLPKSFFKGMDYTVLCEKYEKYITKGFDSLFDNFREKRYEYGMMALSCTSDYQKLSRVYLYVALELQAHLARYFELAANEEYPFDFLLQNHEVLIAQTNHSEVFQDYIIYLTGEISTDAELEKFKQIVSLYSADAEEANHFIALGESTYKEYQTVNLSYNDYLENDLSQESGDKDNSVDISSEED